MHVIFVLSGVVMALPVWAVAELVHAPRLAVIPGAPPVVAGVMNLRGRPVPVLRLARLLGLPDPPAWGFQPLLVMAGQSWAAEIERAEDVAAGEAMVPVPADLSFAECAAGAFTWGGRLVPVLDPKHLLARREARALEDFRAMAIMRAQEFGLGEFGLGGN